jgi:hypothetical protein
VARAGRVSLGGRISFVVTARLLGLAFVFFAAAGLRGAAPVRPPLTHAMMGVANGCFVETVALLDQWRDAHGTEAWARLLQWGAREQDEQIAGHAVAICEAGGVLWSWDINHGWTRLAVEPAQKETPAAVIAAVLRKYPRVTARYPVYRFDFPHTATGGAPAPQLETANAAVRDASLVGAKLAQKRRVNVVRFSHGPEGEKRESAAVVFVFHGRYCVYAPEMGTVPFQVRGDVANLRLIQELLRRMFSGVSEVRRVSS